MEKNKARAPRDPHLSWLDQRSRSLSSRTLSPRHLGDPMNRFMSNVISQRVLINETAAEVCFLPLVPMAEDELLDNGYLLLFSQISRKHFLLRPRSYIFEAWLTVAGTVYS